MIRRQIRDLHSTKLVPTRFCDVIVDGDKVFLEQKTNKNKYERILWEDVQYQVEVAKTASTLHLT